MNKIVLVIFVFLQSAFLANCNGCSQSPPASHNKDYKYKAPMKSVADTVSKISEEKPVETSTGNSSYSSGHSKTKYDNMRGFDPASEDDMDDNGMSRYMENNDDEGWW